jgi:lipopolysaccharide transport system permease protein
MSSITAGGRLLEIVRYRELLKSLVVNDLRLRYRRSVLGFLWSLLNPLLMMIILTVVFSTVMRFSIKDYSVLLLSGLLPWTFLAQSINNALGSVVGKGALLKKVYIPKSIIPLSAVLASFVNFILSFLPFLGVLLVIGHPITKVVVMLPAAMLLIFMFATGVAYIFACLNVFFRDFTHMTDVLIQAWFYASPIIYNLNMVPEKYRALFAWNPMVYIIACFRDPLYEGRLPDATTLFLAVVGSVGSLVIGFRVFTRFERDFVLHV